MGGIVCPKCGFAQAPGPECVRCGLVFSKFATSPPRSAPPADGPPPAVSTPKKRPRQGLLAGVLSALIAAGAVFVVIGRKTPARAPVPDSGASAPAPPAPVSVGGIWIGTVRKAIPGPPVREAIKTVTIESDEAGHITAASVVYRDPGSETVGAGYRIVSDGETRLGEILSKFDASGVVRGFHPDFLPATKGLRPSDEDWKAIEGFWIAPPRLRRAGRARRMEDVSYLLLESSSPAMLCQVGIRKTGFLSFASFDRTATGREVRGRDQISLVIDPPENSVLGSFSHLVWDLSGSTDFLKMRVEATVSGPGGGPDALYLMKSGA